MRKQDRGSCFIEVQTLGLFPLSAPPPPCWDLNMHPFSTLLIWQTALKSTRPNPDSLLLVGATPWILVD